MGKESVYGQKHNRNATDDDVDNNKHFFEIQFKQSLKPFQKVFQSPGIHFVFPGLHIESGGNFNGKYNSNLSRKKCQVPFKYVSIFVKD